MQSMIARISPRSVILREIHPAAFEWNMKPSVYQKSQISQKL